MEQRVLEMVTEHWDRITAQYEGSSVGPDFEELFLDSTFGPAIGIPPIIEIAYNMALQYRGIHSGNIATEADVEACAKAAARSLACAMHPGFPDGNKWEQAWLVGEINQDEVGKDIGYSWPWEAGS